VSKKKMSSLEKKCLTMAKYSFSIGVNGGGIGRPPRRERGETMTEINRNEIVFDEFKHAAEAQNILEKNEDGPYYWAMDVNEIGDYRLIRTPLCESTPDAVDDFNLSDII